MKGNFYLIILFLTLAGFRNSSSTRIISGTVYDSVDKKVIPGVAVRVEGTKTVVSTDVKGEYSISVPEGKTTLSFSFLGYKFETLKIGKSNRLDVWLKPSNHSLNEEVVVGYGTQNKAELTGSVPSVLRGRVSGVSIETGRIAKRIRPWVSENIETYKAITENKFQNPLNTPLSTFAIDVDAASYSNLRRFINNGQLPPKEAVRIEEMLNYFKYNQPAPSGNDPVAIQTELSTAPWNTKHQLLKIGLKAKEVEAENLPASNLVFLIDVSGSMAPDNRLPLVKSSLKMLVDQLRERDRVAIVTYAGGAELKLPATSGKLKTKIRDAIDGLEAGGSTAGGAGLKMAYDVARENFLRNGNNRIILATDGDFNVGASSDSDMEQLVAMERESGVNISVLGYGMGNLKDSKMESIANKGRGNYAYIDNLTEARKAMVTEFGGTLFTVAKDVKVQIEFNPAKVQAYRLIGYENRLLEKEDFNNDRKIGGDMGVGHTVTALYEIIPPGVKSEFSSNIDPLKYQEPQESKKIKNSAELATIKFRYKDPHSDRSRLQQTSVKDNTVDLSKTSDDFRFASAVAELGFLLRNSELKQGSNYDKLIQRAKMARGNDEEGYRSEFIRLAETVKHLAPNNDLAQGTDN